jgi:DNA-binding IclR family transcriptional regulator
MEHNHNSTTITKVGDLLEGLARLGRPASLSDLAEFLPFPKPTLRRLLLQLMRVGMVSQNPDDRRYRLGNRLVTLAAAVLDELEVRRESTDILVALMKETSESVYLTVLDEMSTIYVDIVESERSVRVLSKVGMRRPAWSTATGKVMLAFQEDTARKAAVTRLLRPVTALTITDPAALMKQLKEIRKAGFAVSRDEAEVGVTGVAAPVFGADDVCIAAIGVAIPTYRVTAESTEAVIYASVASARALSTRMSSRSRLEVAPHEEERT